MRSSFVITIVAVFITIVSVSANNNPESDTRSQPEPKANAQKVPEKNAQQKSEQTSDYGDIAILFKPSVANSGLVQVYMGKNGLYRTTPFRLQSFNVGQGYLELSWDISFTGEDERVIVRQLSRPQPLIWLTPHMIKVIAEDEKKAQFQAMVGSTATTSLPLSLDPTKPFKTRIDVPGLTPNAKTDTISVQIEADYVVKSARLLLL